MKMIGNSRFLSLICLVMLLGSIASCKKDDNANTGKVELLSFGPAGVKHGEDISFIGKNLDKVTAIEFKGASVLSTAFKTQTSELIVLTVPVEAERGPVMLKTGSEDIMSKAPIDFDVPFTISSVTAVSRPGENITIKGNLLNWITGVEFADGILDTNFVSQSLTELVIQVPMNAKTGKLIFYGAGTEPLTFESETALTVTLPAITALSPNPIRHATNLTITGTNLDLATGVIFSGVAATQTAFVSQSPTQIVVKVPGGATKGKISLVALSGVKVESGMDLDVSLPMATSLSPNPINPESNLTITGTNLDLVSGVSFTGITASVKTFLSQTPTQLVVKVPAGTLKGKLVFSVLNSTLTTESSTVLDLIGGLPPLSDLGFAIYTDATQNGFQDWSYTVTHDFNSTANVRQGAKSIRAEYGGNGYQGLTFHQGGAASSTAGYTKLEFSVFGEAGTAGKTLNIVVNGNYGAPAQVTIVGGEWTTYSVTMTSIGSPASISEIVMQSGGFSGVVHIDHVGLR
ncbi:MAG: hypothetical protein JWQ25_3008 [Daejeonella sp.]|nr:hypothetical protein [Daejeonella sp.]